MKEYAKSRVKEVTVPLPCLIDPDLSALMTYYLFCGYHTRQHQEPGMKHASGFGVYSNIAPDHYFVICSRL